MIKNTTIILLAIIATVSFGCKGNQIGHILSPNDKDMVGSHAAGSGTFNPLVDEAVYKLLGAAEQSQQNKMLQSIPQGEGISGQPLSPQANICFVGIENRSAEELGDFKEQLFEKIDMLVNDHPTFNSINRNYVDSGLELTRLRPDDLFIPNNMQMFSATMESRGQPFEYMLYAKLTSGTTVNNGSQQRDYLLTLSLVDAKTGQQVKQSAEVKKGYHKNSWAKVANYNPFKRAK